MVVLLTDDIQQSELILDAGTSPFTSTIESNGGSLGEIIQPQAGADVSSFPTDASFSSTASAHTPRLFQSAQGDYSVPHRKRRVLFYGWGAAAAAALRVAALQRCHVLIISHSAQANECDLGIIAKERGFEILITDSVSPQEALDFRPDLLISVSYRKRIPEKILNLTRDAINFHPSLLPKHRGCFSSFHVIFDGDKETGVTCHRMVLEFDKGDIFYQSKIPVKPDSTSFSLYKDLLGATTECFQHVIEPWIQTGELGPSHPQEGEASYHYRKLPFDGVIQKNWDFDTVSRFIRAMTFPPLEGAVWYKDDGQRVVVDCMSDYQRLMAESPTTCSTDTPALE